MPWLTPEEVEAKVTGRLVAEGERVEIDQDLLEMRVDGAMFLLPSPLEGILIEWQVESGDYVTTDQVLAVIEID